MFKKKFIIIFLLLSVITIVQCGLIKRGDPTDYRCEVQHKGSLSNEEKNCASNYIKGKEHFGRWIETTISCNGGRNLHVKSKQKMAWLNPANCYEGLTSCHLDAISNGVESNWGWMQNGVAECQYQYWFD